MPTVEPAGPEVSSTRLGKAQAGEAAEAATRATSTIGLCLSGGGYRAMLYHVGVLRRLNEAGWLPTLTRISSVSGGSIVAGLLGRAWADLEFEESGVAARFHDCVEQPILGLAERTIDVRAVLLGLWPGRDLSRFRRRTTHTSSTERRCRPSPTRRTIPSSSSWPPT